MIVRAAFAWSLIFVVSVGSSFAAIQHYQIKDTFSTSGFSASWLHSGESALKGTVANGARMNGRTTSRITGVLQGDLVNNQLQQISGSITGNLMQLSSYLNSTLTPANPLSMSDSFELKLGSSSSVVGGTGALQFKSPGANPGEYTGGFFDFSLFVPGKAAGSILDGTFFFKPQAESGNAPLSPNRGDANEFTLWGNNWMHDGGPASGSNLSNFTDWVAFLTSLGHPNPGSAVLLDGGTGLLAALGIDIYVLNDQPLDPPPGGSDVPEPTSMFVWSMIVACSANFARKAKR